MSNDLKQVGFKFPEEFIEELSKFSKELDEYNKSKFGIIQKKSKTQIAYEAINSYMENKRKEIEAFNGK